MGNSQDPSLLDYARFYGIARDSTTVDLTYVDNNYQPASETPPLLQNALSEFQTHIYETQKNVESDLRREKLNIRKESARLLSSVIEQARADKLDINWDDFLPKFNQSDELKVELPMLEVDSIMDTLRYTSPLRYDENTVDICHIDESCQKLTDEDITSKLLTKADEILGDTKPMKINCSRESMMLIQRAREVGGFPFAEFKNIMLRDMMPDPEEQIYSKSSPFLLPDVDETYYRSPSPVPMSLMLPSPASSSSYRPGLQCNNVSAYSSISEKGDCSEVISKQGDSFTSDERNQLGVEPSLDESKAEVDIAVPETVSRFSSDDNWRGENGLPNTSQEIDDASNYMDSDSSVICLMPRDGCVPIECDTTQEREIRAPSVLLVHERCQATPIATIPVSHHSSFDSPSPLCPSDPCSTEPRNHQPYPMSNMSSSQHSKPEEPLCYSDTVEYLGSVESSFGERPGKAQEPTFEDVGDMEYAGQYQLPGQDIATPPHENDKILSSKSPNITVIGTTTSSGTMPNSIDHDFSADTSLERQKRRYEERQDVSRKDRKIDRPVTTFLANHKGKHTLSWQSSMLGSLSAFLETRGQVERRQVTTTGSYFANNILTGEIGQHQNPTMDTIYHHKYEEPNGAEELPHVGLEHATQRCPQFQTQNHEQPLLFLSTTLLRSHLSIVQTLEKLKSPPAVIYRDYEDPIQNQSGPRNSTSQTNARHNLPQEADIIVSPTTGIILTTLQATTQLYLPGHKPNPQTNGAKSVNSPLRERIFLLAPRYKHLYVLVTHGSSFPNGAQSNPSPWTADRRLLASFTSLTAFCDSMSAYSTISLVLVPPSPDTIIEWIQALAHKHAYQLPSCPVGSWQGIPLTSGNPTPKIQFDIETMEKETRWELFLRRVGLNPYAAQVIMAILRQRHDPRIGNDNLELSDHVEKEICALSRFIEMSSEHRQELFPDLIGERINAILEKDWQCDWALNFD
ncbi:hypothetical protein BDV28DRAFT_145226 [Aspergillus coremiiformis]|uniref:Uncharacterized protein n=1 Tax=Aspergillus coremiiformis TaxID=138285 RepID=A0A5N6ZHU3_9EURO|nr:hypothetical protein BDV28DRAFT_145226 [Aspergillus coremiiformis]